MAAAALLAVTIIPVLMVYFISERDRARAGWPRRQAVAVSTAAVILAPAIVLARRAAAAPATITGGSWSWAGSPLMGARRAAAADLVRGAQSDQSSCCRRSTTRSSCFVHAVPLAGGGPRRGRRSPARSGRSAGSAASSCRRSRRATCSTCRRPIPGISMTKARELLQQTDTLIMQLPRGGDTCSARSAGRDRHRSGTAEHARDDDHAAPRQEPLADPAGRALLRGLARLGGLAAAPIWPTTRGRSPSTS